MKIGIITFWQSSDNYGQLLQAWALQQILKKEGHDPFLIRYNFLGRKIKISLWKKCLKLFLVYPIIRKINRQLQAYKEKEVRKDMETKNAQRHFEEFRNANLSMSDNLYNSLSSLQQRPPQADCYITGSDQVWAQLLNEKENQTFFLNFGNNDVLRIAYAPSFAMTEYPNALKMQLKQQLGNIDFISVREKSGVQICNNAGRDDVKVVLDPTLLIEGRVYQNFFIKTKNTSKPYLYIYCLNIESPEEMEWKNVKKYIDDYNMDIVVTPSSGVFPSKELFDGVTYSYCSIEEWLSNIYNSSLMVTTSFHGIVFCIQMHRNFVYIPLRNSFHRANNRVLDLLKDLDLMGKVCKNGKFRDAAQCYVDWNNVEKLLNNKRIDSIRFLRTALGQNNH